MQLRIQSVNLRIILQQLRTYLNRVAWIALDAVRRFRFAIVAVTILDIIGVLSGAAMLGGIVLLVKNAETPDPLVVWGISIPSVQNVPRMLAFAAVLAALGLLSAVSAYATKWLIGRIVIQYHNRCVKRLLQIVADPGCRGWQSAVEGPPYKAIIQLTGGDCRIISAALRHLLGIILPLATFLFATTALFVLDPLITLVLLPLAGLYIVPFYLINRGVARQQREFIRVNRTARGGLVEAIKNALAAGQHIDPAQQEPQACLSTQHWKRSEDLFCKRKLADDRMHLLNATFFVICLLGLFGFFAIQMHDGGGSWAAFLMYLVSLRFAISALRHVTSILVNISRYLPHVDRYCRFIERAEQIRKKRLKVNRSTQLPARFAIECSDHQLWNSAAQLEVRLGQAVWILIPWRPMHGDLEAVASALESRLNPPADLFTSAFFLAVPSAEIAPQSGVAAYPASPPIQSKEVEPAATTVAAAAALQDGTSPASTMRSQTALIDRTREPVPTTRSDEFAIEQPEQALAPSGARAIFVSAKVLARTARNGADLVGPARAHSCLFIVAGPTLEAAELATPGLPQKVAGGVVVRDSQIIACGDLDWLNSNLSSIRSFLQRDSALHIGDEADEADEGDEDDVELDV
ncbi:MAG: hypothetical protein L0Y44_14830 [Phycisphaerales bacterium]|nr:hypothetical protein [Phycisphaerales bacterium]MCI0631917.1 hypothetical protein [Phycisphaerales bacterium]MCI0675788.1 hypothetical protein [Phycisphaerales bacterium]